MTKLKRSDCAILPLVLKRKWYDMIASGEKREEYRDAKPYWDKRIRKWRGKFLPGEDNPVVAFSLGYRKPTMWFTVIDVIRSPMWWRARTFPEWGEPNEPHWVISLGARVELEDQKQRKEARNDA